MADIVYVSFDVLVNSFKHVADAIHGWGDFEGDTFVHEDSGLIVAQNCNDLFVISRADQRLEQIAFRPFNLRVVTDFMAIFGSAD